MMVADTARQGAADELRARATEFAHAAVAHQYERTPGLAERHGPQGRTKCVADVRYHLAFLAEAVALDRPALFLDYIAWAKTVMFHHGVNAEDFKESLESIDHALGTTLAPDMGEAARRILRAARHALPDLPDEPPEPRREDNPLADLCGGYLAALLDGDRAAASRMIFEAVDNGTSIGAIYRHVFRESQIELGLLWQSNALSIAQEHYCTAATQFIMTQLYPHVLATPRNGRTIIAVCVSDESHEIGMRMVSDLFELNGWDSFYVGANTPTSSIVQLLCERRPTLLAVSATMTFHLPRVIELIKAVRRTPVCAAVPILVGGRVFSTFPDIARLLGADGTAQDAEQAVQWAEQFVGGGGPSRHVALRTPSSVDGEPIGSVPTILDVDDRVEEPLALEAVDEIAYDGMARLNSELTTLQRQMAKERVELERLSEQLEQSNVELEAARQAADAANHAKSAFLANMSHEIRTPLTAILGYTELLRDQETSQLSAEQRAQAMETIFNAGQHLLTLINDVLDLAKIEANRLTIELVDTPLLGILGEVDSLMRPTATGKGVAFEVRFKRPVPTLISGDPTRLRQILLNLLGNAVKFTEAGSVTLIVDYEPSSPLLTIDVEDTGPGISPEQADKLFTAFSQADASVARRHGGTGLGLVIVRRLAELMHGSVELVRTEPGKGSCFRLTLPLEQLPDAVMAERLDAISGEPKRSTATEWIPLTGRILLAEDGADNQRLIAFVLRKAGATVAVADNGRLAFDMLMNARERGDAHDLLLTDMQMPEMDGYALARRLRKQGVSIPIIALTAHAMAEDKQRCLDAGCDDYASKPIDRVELLTKCAVWLGRSSERGQRSGAS